ncbi:venom serine carboxypeptidase-like [Rhynchophorus ferrugineus]|uniref:venom serine carboxypeptidase-like n=1 Tax=Rhynchophorus ferrugineus TaxID=354439 RepID=UPI003FCE61BD
MKLLVTIVALIVTLKGSHSRFPFLKQKPRNYVCTGDNGEPLILTPYLESNRFQEARNAAEVHLDAFQDVVSYSGYFNVDKENNASLFFWYFPSANDYQNDPVVLWLQGGPGSSSLYGLFIENGPFAVESDGSVSLREYSWHKNHSLIFIDQPVGTGFSYTNNFYVTNQTEVGNHLYDALTQFFTLFPELQKNDFFISGESYAGKYVPAIGYTILKNNPTASLKINLQGLLIGNGLSYPLYQMIYGYFLYQIGLTDKNGVQTYNEIERMIIELINKEDYARATEVFNGFFDYFISDTGLENVYNFLKQELDDPDYWETFLNSDEVRKALHVGNQVYSSQSDPVYDSLKPDMMKSVAPWISELLSNYRILLYNGQLDIIVCYISTANYLQVLDFDSTEEYLNATRKVWYVDDYVAGFSKSAGNLTEVMVRNAGHMVPADQPKAAYDLLYKFVRNIRLA